MRRTIRAGAERLFDAWTKPEQLVEVIERPRLLTYTWRLEGGSTDTERVSVRFESRGADTEVIVTHERVASGTLRDEHEHGWIGCLDGLARYAAAQVSPGRTAAS